MREDLTNFIKKEFDFFNENFLLSIENSMEDFAPIIAYTNKTKGKQLRPIIGILCAKCLGEFNEQQNLLLQAIELIHNATLFHDDVIDEAAERRNQKTLHKEFSSKIAILTGDYFLSCALRNIYKIKNPELNELFADCMIKICEGEIEQNLTLNKILPLEKYIEKTRRKTALLFKLVAQGISILSGTSNKQLEVFGENFGILFQINDDLKNFMPAENKPILNDLKSGVITAPIIFLSEEYPKVNELLKRNQYDAILELLNKSNALKKTRELINKYKLSAQKALNELPHSQAKNQLLDLLSEF